MTTQHPVQEVRLSRLLGRFWTLANLLSLLRLFLVIPVAYLILKEGSRLWLFGLLLLGAMTDWFDGRVARWSKTVSEWGKVLDPLADKVAAAVIVMALAVRGSLPLWFLVMIVVRDVFIVLGGVVLAKRTAHVVMSLYVGKIAVSALSVTILAALLEADAPVMKVCVWVTTALLAYSFLLYFLRFAQLMRYGRLPIALPLEDEPAQPGMPVEQQINSAS